MRNTPVYLAIVFGVVCMSTSSIMIRLCSAPAMAIALYRVIFTVGIAAALEGKYIKSHIARIEHRDLLFIVGSGFFLALHFAFWITSLEYTSVSSSVLFTNLQVIFVLIFSAFFLKEKVNSRVLGGILIALTGSALIAGGDWQMGRFIGDMLALASGFFVAIYFLIGRNIRARVRTITYTLLISAVAGLVLLISCLGMGTQLTGFPGLDWLLFILMALGPGIGGHTVLNWALKYVKAPVVAVSILGEAVGASILAYLIFNEALLWYQLIGGAFILTGIYTAVANERTGTTGNAKI
ncbi:DMT family transporter [Syntrophomonas erecta]